jgi:hypothetical protein
VYLGSPSGLSSSPDWAAEADEVLAAFGHSVATAGDVNGDGFSDVIVGAKWADGGETNEGRAYVYLGSPGGISTSAEWILESDQADAQFGFAVGTAGDVNGDGYSDVIVGALFFDNGETDEGRAFVYHGAADVLALTHVWEAHSDQSFADFGHALASAGDVDGDGYGDVIVGAPNYNSGQFNEGRALVYRGTPAGVATSASWHVDSNQVGAYLGESVASAGDVNGDGYSDVIVGAPFHDADTVGGRAFVYHGSSSGLATTYAWAGQADLPDCVYGSKVACAGDVNGDGYSDVIVGAYGYGTPSYGRAFVYLGSSTGLATTPSWTADSGQQGAGFGVAVSTAGDVNGDGFSDVIVGAWAHDNGETSEGRAFVYLGSHSGLSTTPAWTAESNEVGGTLGRDATTAGDVNGDHYSDVIVSCRGCSNGEHAEGVAFVYLGSSAGLSTTPDWTGETNQINAGFSGIAVASAGDVNGDGFSDVVFGASAYDVGSHLQAGRMALHLGSSTGLALSPAWVIEGDHQGANVGNFLARAGDVNGDGYGDLLTGGGGAFLYLGNEGRGGWTIAPQQRQASDVTPIQSLNRSNDRLEFRIHLAFARTLAGFDWSTGIAPLANLEWEVEPLSSPLDGDDVRSGIGDVAIDGSLIRFNEIASFEDIVTSPSIGHHVAAISRPYHWRARIRTNNPLFPVTPWVTIPGNNVSETKLRAGPVRAKR